MEWIVLVDDELFEILTSNSYEIDYLAAWPYTQRHKSIMAFSNSGEKLWIKIEQVRDCLASLDHEIEIIKQLQSTTISPKLIMDGTLQNGCRYFITEDAGNPTSVDEIKNNMIKLIEALNLLDESKLSIPHSLSENGVFSSFPDLKSIVSDELRSTNTLSTFCDSLGFIDYIEPEEASNLHGSLSLNNLLVNSTRRVVLIDYEATRKGPRSFDYATLLGSIIDEGGINNALDIVNSYANRLSVPLLNIAGWLLFRAICRNRENAMARHILTEYLKAICTIVRIARI